MKPIKTDINTKTVVCAPVPLTGGTGFLFSEWPDLMMFDDDHHDDVRNERRSWRLVWTLARVHPRQ